MALIKCKECGGTISSTAEHCPSCGCTTKAGELRNRQKELWVDQLSAIGLLIAGIVLWMSDIFLIGLIGGVILTFDSAANIIIAWFRLLKIQGEQKQTEADR